MVIVTPTWVKPITALETYTPPVQTLIDHDIEVHVPSERHRGPPDNTTDLESYTVVDNFYQHNISALETYTPVSQTLIDHDIIAYTAPILFNYWGFELLPADVGRAVRWGGVIPQPFF